MAAGSGVFRGDAFAHTPVSCTFADFLSHAATATALQEDDCETGGERSNARKRPLHPGNRGEDACQSHRAEAETPGVQRGNARHGEPHEPRAVDGGGEGGPSETLLTAEEHLYLAQAPITSSAPGRCGLAALQEDVRLPDCLTGLPVDDINLWMSNECVCRLSQQLVLPLCQPCLGWQDCKT